MVEYAMHAGDDGFVHYCDRADLKMRWLCGKGNSGSVQRADLDLPGCPECKRHLHDAARNGGNEEPSQ